MLGINKSTRSRRYASVTYFDEDLCGFQSSQTDFLIIINSPSDRLGGPRFSVGSMVSMHLFISGAFVGSSS